MSDPRAEVDYEALREEINRSLRRGYEQADRWRRGDFTIVPREGPREDPGDGLKVTMMTTYLPISEEHAMDLGLIPDTRPPAPRPSWWQRGRWRVATLVRPVRLRLAARIGGVSIERLEEGTWL